MTTTAREIREWQWANERAAELGLDLKIAGEQFYITPTTSTDSEYVYSTNDLASVKAFLFGYTMSFDRGYR